MPPIPQGLVIQDVFTPAPSGVGPNPPAAGSWLATLLANAGVVGLSTSSWQPGGVTRSMLAIVANALMLGDVNTSIMAQGGFLDFAASGSVTFLDPISFAKVTQVVTVDPSTLSGTALASWLPGWLDILADSVYNVQRGQATFATVTQTFTNSTAIASATYQPGQFHVANPATGQTYSNTIAFSIAPSGTTTCPFLADVAGGNGNASPGTITQLVTSVVGVVVTNATNAVGGAGYESNALLATRCRLKTQAISGNGPKGAYIYWALSAFAYLPTIESQAPAPMTTPITQAVVSTNPATGVVTTLVANGFGYGVGGSNGAPVVAGVANLAVLGATNATPIVVTVASTSLLASLMVAQLSGVIGNLAANGYWVINVIDATTFSLSGSVGNGAWTSGGVVEAGDLGLVDAVLQANAVPNGVTSVTVSALSQYVTVVATVYVPAAAATTNLRGQIHGALITYFNNVPIGGYVGGVPTPNTMPFEGVQQAIANVSSAIRDVTLTLNGTAADVSIGATSVPVVTYPGPTQNPIGGILFVTF